MGPSLTCSSYTSDLPFLKGNLKPQSQVQPCSMLSAPTGEWKVPSDGRQLKGTTAGTLEDRVRGKNIHIQWGGFQQCQAGCSTFLEDTVYLWIIWQHWKKKPEKIVTGQLLDVYQQHVIVAERSFFEKIHIKTSYKQTSKGIHSVLASVLRTQLEQLFQLKVPHHKVTASGTSNKCKDASYEGRLKEADVVISLLAASFYRESWLKGTNKQLFSKSKGKGRKKPPKH